MIAGDEKTGPDMTLKIFNKCPFCAAEFPLLLFRVRVKGLGRELECADRARHALEARRHNVRVGALSDLGDLHVAIQQLDRLGAHLSRIESRLMNAQKQRRAVRVKHARETNETGTANK